MRWLRLGLTGTAGGPVILDNRKTVGSTLVDQIENGVKRGRDAVFVAPIIENIEFGKGHPNRSGLSGVAPAVGSGTDRNAREEAIRPDDEGAIIVEPHLHKGIEVPRFSIRPSDLHIVHVLE